MSYVKTTWVTGDIVTAPKLNNLESGVEANDLNKLNKPSGNGTAGQLLISNGDGSTSWTDTDTTLEESGKAADAKATGDAIGEINEALETKAEIDGYYEEMTVGDAEQLVSTVYVEESTPYLYRTTGGSADVGHREYLDEIEGVSLAWNQLIQNSGKSFSNTTTDSGATSLTLRLRQSASPYTTLLTVSNAPTGLIQKMFTPTSSFTGIALLHIGASSNITAYTDANQNIIAGHKYLMSIKVTGNDPKTVGGFSYDNFNIIDLTLAFGATIADYAYSLETAEAGTGIAWLKQYIDLDKYYAYDAGTLKHVENLQSHDTVGFNQWDEVWENGVIYSSGSEGTDANSIRSKNYNPCLPNTTYYGDSPSSCLIVWYDGNKDFISRSEITNTTATSPNNAHYFRISCQSYGTTYKNDICINLSWSGYRNGEYEPYEKHSYALDSSVVLRGIPKLVDGQMVYDGDEYLYDGTINRRYGIVDLGTLRWTKTADGIFTSYIADRRYGSGKYTLRCAKYATYEGSNSTSSNIQSLVTANGNGIYVNGGSISFFIADSAYTTVETFTTAINGIYIVYELDTPTTETADPYTQVQICDDFGTEQFVTTSIIPVGTETRYPANLRDKLQHLPSLAETDGTYLIQQTDKEMSLIPFSGYVTEESLTETLEDYAVTDGYYEAMTVGNAEELVTGLTEEENVPFIFRTAGGSLEIGAREDMTVVGGSLAWNQLRSINSAATYTKHDLEFTQNNDGSFSVSGTNNSATDPNFYVGGAVSVISGHIYLITGRSAHFGTSYYGALNKANSNPLRDGVIATASSTDTATLYLKGEGLSVDDAINEKIIPQLFDLTQMFGTTIANYILTLETATAGAGVAWFKKLFSKDYYPYSQPNLAHVNASAFKTIGFNQWDGTYTANTRLANYETGATETANGYNLTDYIRVIPNTTYCASRTESARTLFYDANKNVIPQTAWTFPSAGSVFITPSNAYYMRVTIVNTYVQNFCLYIHWDSTRDGEYEPYTEHSYPLDSNLVLRGIPKLDADNNLYYDGDTYQADGTVTRNYRIVTYNGTENWQKESSSWNSNSLNIYYLPLAGDIAGVYPSSTSEIPPLVSDKFITKSNTDARSTADYGWVAFAGGTGKASYLEIGYNANSADDFKTYLASNPLTCVYKLYTPTTETADTYQTPQIVDNWGTEEFVVTEQNGVEVPVGHSTIYPISLRDKLEAAPDLPADDGDYVLRMSGNEASYARLASEFPTPPTTDGNYVLKATVTNGTATLTWEAQA